MSYYENISRRIKSCYGALEVYKRDRTERGYMRLSPTTTETEMAGRILMLQKLGNLILN